MSFYYTRKPDFSNIENFNYNQYWMMQDKGTIKIRKKLKPREWIFKEWIPARSSVLVIGCGDSCLPLMLKNEKHCLVEVNDISQKIIKTQKKAGVMGSTGNIGAPGFKVNKKYDYIILSEVIEHIPDPESLIMKIKNKARFIIFSIPNSAFYRYRISLLLKGRFFTQWNYYPGEHLRFWSHIDFLDWLKALKLKVIRSEASNGLQLGPVRFYKFWPNLFGHQICYLVTNE
jgi:methionine biosynthesis protein MetW